MKNGYVYALYYDGNPFYIGQTKRRIYQRYKEHRVQTFNGNGLRIYEYIRSVVSDWHEFKYLIHIRVIKECSIDELDSVEIDYINLCKQNNIKIYNTTHYI
jgi:hypothetical protein